jgi:uncharacterized spore protein YtfJ
MTEPEFENTLSKLDAVKDMLTVQRVFGDPYQMDGVSVLPVAVVRGAGGGGAGGGTAPDEKTNGSGAGVGFGVNARPLGVFVAREGDVQWRPAVDVMRIVLGGQIVALVAILALRRILSRR